METRKRYTALAIIVLTSLLFLSCSTEKKDWEAASKDGSIQAYQNFIEKHPNSPFVSNAAKKIEEIKERIDWEDANKRNDIRAYQAFITNHPESVHVSEAKEKSRSRIQEEAPLAVNSFDSGYIEAIYRADPDNPFFTNNLALWLVDWYGRNERFLEIREDLRKSRRLCPTCEVGRSLTEKEGKELLQKSITLLNSALSRAEGRMISKEPTAVMVVRGKRGLDTVRWVKDGEKDPGGPLKAVIEQNIKVIEDMIAK